MKAWKEQALEQARKDIVLIEDEGHQVVMLTDYHWKIDGVDVWPSSRKFMRRGVVRTYKRLNEIV